jgi:hypothetical protein
MKVLCILVLCVVWLGTLDVYHRPHYKFGRTIRRCFSPSILRCHGDVRPCCFMS